MRLKLMRLPHGTNRNRTLRRAVEMEEEEVNLVEVEHLFRRFWRQWRQLAVGVEGETGEGDGPLCA